MVCKLESNLIQVYFCIVQFRNDFRHILLFRQKKTQVQMKCMLVCPISLPQFKVEKKIILDYLPCLVLVLRSYQIGMPFHKGFVSVYVHFSGK